MAKNAKPYKVGDECLELLSNSVQYEEEFRKMKILAKRKAKERKEYEKAKKIKYVKVGSKTWVQVEE